MKIANNHVRLKSVLVLNQVSREKLSELLDISKTSLENRINNKLEFKLSEIKFIKEHFNLTEKEAWEMFMENN